MDTEMRPRHIAESSTDSRHVSRKDIHLDVVLSDSSVSEAYIATFCKNASDLQAIQTRTLRQERDEPDFDDVRGPLQLDSLQHTNHYRSKRL